MARVEDTLLLNDLNRQKDPVSSQVILSMLSDEEKPLHSDETDIFVSFFK